MTLITRLRCNCPGRYADRAAGQYEVWERRRAESDFLGLFLDDAITIHEMVTVEGVGTASQGQALPEFFSTYPDPGRRIERIQMGIQSSDQCLASQAASVGTIILVGQ
jgi:hypothetical protein